jgi:hypothetical protein
MPDPGQGLERARARALASRQILDARAGEITASLTGTREPTSAVFTCQVFQNEYLPPGDTDVHAIVSVDCARAGPAPAASGAAAEIVMVGTSSSLQGERIAAVRAALDQAIDQLLDGTWFALIAGTEVGVRVFPSPGLRSPMIRLTPATRAAAKDAAQGLTADGGRAMGSWLRLATGLFQAVPTATHRHAILLTDGHNHDETIDDLHAAVREAAGTFQCDVRGLGADWSVPEALAISRALLGTVDLVPTPDDLPAAVSDLVRRSMSRGVSDVRLRVWVPRGAQLLFLREVYPTVVDLTDRGDPAGPLTNSYPTGAWGEECRDYHLAVRFAEPRLAGTHQAVARVQITVNDEAQAHGLVTATWSDDVIGPCHPTVALYTGQSDLAEAIDDALAIMAECRTTEATTRTGADDGTGQSDRSSGPWDVSECPEVEGLVDLGALRLPGRDGMELRLEVEEASGLVTSVTVQLEGSAVQLQAFAAPRTQGIWNEIRAEIAAGISRQGGTVEEVPGPFGRELIARIPAPTPDGRTGYRLARFVGVNGPRWFLRAVFDGPAASEPEPGRMMEAVLRDVVVVRGAEAMAPRDLLPLRLPVGLTEGEGDTRPVTDERQPLHD